ncbi:MAG: hypothetical protein ABSG14_03830 [Verrucomicrobiia bacterium]|jgi:hypothetical protein
MEREDIQIHVARQCRIEHAPDAICAALRGCRAGTAMAVEATGNWYWIVTEIEQEGLRPLLVHPRKAKLMRGLSTRPTSWTCTGSIASDARNVIPFPDPRCEAREGTIVKAERLGGLLNFYHQRVA